MSCRQRRFRKGRDLIPNLSDLDEKGRLHFFYHSPASKLPVRDILNQQHKGYKTEPYIEKSAENYCVECNPRNIRGFLKSSEKYLFLFTTRRDEESKHKGKVYVVGYIKKESFEMRPKGFYAVIGSLNLYSFDDAYCLGKSTAHNNPRQLAKKLSGRKTQQILDNWKSTPIWPLPMPSGITIRFAETRRFYTTKALKCFCRFPVSWPAPVGGVRCTAIWLLWREPAG